MVRVGQGAVPMKISQPGSTIWPATWKRSYDAQSSILEVTMDMNNFDEFKQNYALAANDRCKPANFCSCNSTDGTCGCSLPSGNPNDPIYKACQHACSQWAMKDVNCPKDGCYGFAVVFPAGFTAQDQGKPAKTPPSTCTVKSGNPDWTKMFMAPNLSTADKCKYSNLPAPQFC